MGLDAYLFPMRQELTLGIIKDDENLGIEKGGLFTYIQLKDNPQSAIGLYSDEEIVDYVKVWSHSLQVLKYIAETYDVLIGADGFFNDAGYRGVMQGMKCENGEEMESLIIEFYTEEMIQYVDTYEWCEEYLLKLSKWREENKPPFQ